MTGDGWRGIFDAITIVGSGGRAIKSAWAVSYLRRASRVVSPQALATIYKSHIRSVMEYACPIWMCGPKDSLACLDIVQAKAIKLIGATHSCNIQELAHRRSVAGFCVMHRLTRRAAPAALHDLYVQHATTDTNIDFFTPPSFSKPAFWTMLPCSLPHGTGGSRTTCRDLNRYKTSICKLRVNKTYSLEGLYIYII